MAISTKDRSVAKQLNHLLMPISAHVWVGSTTKRIFEDIKTILVGSPVASVLIHVNQSIHTSEYFQIADGKVEKIEYFEISY